MNNQQTRWPVEAFIEPADKISIRSFVRNEIAYYNALLASMGSRLRTMPEVFNEMSDNLLIEAAVRGVNAIEQDLDERTRLFLEAVSGPAARSVHPATRAAMAVEMLRAHRIQADGLQRTKGEDLAAPVSLLSPHDGRVKRHVQLPKPAVTVLSSEMIRIPYARQPILIRGVFPITGWNVLVVRDTDRPGEEPGPWMIEFRKEPSDYLLRLTDPPLKINRRAAERTR
jgi:hypothetical protein